MRQKCFTSEAPISAGCLISPFASFWKCTYLTAWDEFAQGNNSLAPVVKTDAQQFSAELTAALKKSDGRAPSRFVFYAVVQVGGFIPLD